MAVETDAERIATLESTVRDLAGRLKSLNNDCIVNSNAVSRVDDMIRGDGHNKGLTARMHAVEKTARIGSKLAGTIGLVVLVEAIRQIILAFTTP